MSHIYIALVDTPGILAYLIRTFLKQRYIHVVLSMDSDLEEAYSVGRRHPAVPLLAGFEKEDKQAVFRAFPTARYLVYELDCSAAQKAAIRRGLEEDFQQRYRLHYAVLGLFFILLGRPFYQKNHYTCSSYVARLLGQNGMLISEKHFSLVTPRDFYLLQRKKVIYEGSISGLLEDRKETIGRSSRCGGEVAYGR